MSNPTEDATRLGMPHECSLSARRDMVDRVGMAGTATSFLSTLSAAVGPRPARSTHSKFNRASLLEDDTRIRESRC